MFGINGPISKSPTNFIFMHYVKLEFHDGPRGPGELFHDFTSAPGEDAIDGVKVDVEGNVSVLGPGGLWILSPDGRHLGTIRPPRHPHNMTWGDADGRTLYMTAQDRVYRMRLKIPGVRSPR